MKLKVFSILGCLALSAGIPANEAVADPYSYSPYTTVPCGGEGMAACSITQAFAFQMYSAGFFQCDKNLVVSGSNCVRVPSLIYPNEFANPNSWIGFAMKEQMYGIGAHQQANWGNYFGSHNSYSSYADNANSQLSADQQMNITDQLQAGMRIIRMDPRFYAGQIRLCHNSDYGILDENDNHTNCNTNGKNFPVFKVPDQILSQIGQYLGYSPSVSDLISLTGLAGPSSEGRLYALGMHEVGHWLKNNPGEFVIIRLLGTRQLDSAHYYWVDDAITQELGDMVYLPPANGTTLDHWPSMRELRGSDKRVIVFSDAGTHATWSWDTYVINDGYTDTSGYRYPTCQNQDGLPVASRKPNQWSYVGEDRSGSNFFGSGPKGTLGEGAVADATKCGYSMINVDFLLAGPAAGKMGIDFNFCANISDKCNVHLALWDYTFPDPDSRRESFIWSWGINEFGTDGPAAMALKTTGAPLQPPFILKTIQAGHWMGQTSDGKHAFACAGPGTLGGTFPDPAHPIDYTWKLSSGKDVWSMGESVCQKEFGSQFHFWAPASGEENQKLFELAFATRLSNIFSPDFDPLWLNHVAGQITAAPTALSLSAPQTATVNVLGGKGGKLSVGVKGSHLKANVSGTQVNVQAQQGLTPGNFNESILIQETDPNTGDLQAPLEIPVTVKVPSVTLHLRADIPGFSLNPGPQVLDGKDYATPADVQVVPNSTHQITATSPFNISANSRAMFKAWADGGAQARKIQVNASDLTITAQYTPQYLVTVNVVPAQGGTVTGGGWVDLHGDASLRATPSAGYVFQQFQGNIKKTTQNPYLLSGIGKPVAIEADFLLIGDLNGDGIVDRKDLAILQHALNTNANGPFDIRDLNHDGRIDALDMRILVTKCTYPHCASHP